MLKYDKCLKEKELYVEKNVNNSNNAEGKIVTKTNVESDALTVIFLKGGDKARLKPAMLD